MKIGTYYYPEQWPREQWERDFDNIAKMGLQIVHMTEFAWFALEPKPGEFQFEWLDHCIDLAKARSLEVILCTPTAAPPIWLSTMFPQTLPVNEYGLPLRFGGRRHYNPLAPALHNAARRIVTAMADRYGNHPSIIGWQIDNEYGHHFDQSPTTHDAFRRWLRNKYGDIQGLNRAWGNQFWNTCYTDFNQILFPPERTPRYDNPHHMLDASRFWSWAFAQFNRVQSEILKSKVGNRFITTNFMHLHPDCDPGDMASDLTLSSWDSYPINGREPEMPGQTFRMADPASVGLIHDQMASYQNRFGLMELQPGQVNWSGVPIQVYPGAVRLWIWTAFAHGAEFVTTYRFRQPRFGIELFHHGLVGPDGVTQSPGGREFSLAANEMRKLDLNRVPALADEKYDPRRTVGLVLDFDQFWYFLSLPQAKRWNWPLYLQMWYGAICRLGLKVKILRPGQDWPSDLPMIIAPALQMVDDKLVSQLESYARGGGNLILTCRTGLMDRTGQLWEGPVGKPILSMIGGNIPGYDGLPAGMTATIEMDGQKFDWSIWGDQIEPNPGTQVLARYADQFYSGAAAATQSKYENGVVSYFGVYSSAPLIEAFVEKIANGVGDRLAISKLPDRLHVLRRGPYQIALNYNDAEVQAPAGAGAKFIIGTRAIAPAGIAVWEE